MSNETEVTKQTASRGPLEWFEELVTELPAAEKYRQSVNNLERLVKEAIDIGDEGQRRVEVAQKYMRDETKKFIIDVLTAMWDKSAAYTTAVISVGYVALFTAWSTTKEDVAPEFSRLIVVMALASLVVFILFEVGKMIYQHVHVMRLLSVLKEQGVDFDVAFQRYQGFSETSYRVHQWIWTVALALTIFFGLSSAGVLIYANLERMFGMH